MQGAALPVEAANTLVPASLKITGPAVSMDALRAYMSRVTERAQRLGLKVLVFGSAGARNVPEGFDRHRANEQIVEFLKMLAPMADKRHLTLVIEPLNRGESNIINSVGEAVEFAKKVNHPSIKVLVDSYHFWLEKESLDNLRDHMPWIRHVHLADVNGRVPPGESHSADDYRAFFRVLKNANYDLGISVETGQPWDIASRATPVLALVRKAWEDA